MNFSSDYKEPIEKKNSLNYFFKEFGSDKQNIHSSLENCSLLEEKLDYYLSPKKINKEKSNQFDDLLLSFKNSKTNISDKRNSFLMESLNDNFLLSDKQYNAETLKNYQEYFPNIKNFNFREKKEKCETEKCKDHYEHHTQVPPSPIKGNKLKKAKKTKDSKVVTTCKCKKSKCLRLYCACFQNGGVCGETCSCTGCFNKEEFKKVREFVIKKTKEINPLAFKNKYQKLATEKEDKGKVFHTRGCRCKKIKCDRNYCECFKGGVKCSNMCKCDGCDNCQVKLERDDLIQIYQKKRRKKHKIVIGKTSENGENDIEKNVQTDQQTQPVNYVTFVPYKKNKSKYSVFQF
jgi:hypothetical protein